METSFRFADELGPMKVIHLHEPSIDLKAVLVVDNVAKGPSIGGLRMAPDVSTEECFRLARAMTFKNAAAGLPHGGGKSVLYGDPKMPREQKERLIRTLARMLEDEKHYIFGPDMGTDEECMAWVKDEINRSVGLPREIGGIPLDEIGATGFGISHVVDVALPSCDFEIEGARVAVQGFGAVGKNAARFLAGKGAILVAAADSQGTIHNPDGLDIGDLIELKERFQYFLGRRRTAPEAPWLGYGEKAEYLAVVWGTLLMGVTGRYPTTEAGLARGHKIYQDFCLGCHGPVGDGMGPAQPWIYPPPFNFTILKNREISGGILYYQIMNGITGSAMPYFKRELESEKIWDVGNYVAVYFINDSDANTEPRGIDASYEPVK